MVRTEVKMMEILSWFLYQDDVRKAETEDGLIKIYEVGDNLIRVDIVKEVNYETKSKQRTTKAF